MSSVRLTVAQALVRFLARQWSERDGVEQRFFAGCFGIFGHGNVAGVGQALLESELDATDATASAASSMHDGADTLRYYQARNDQAMVHAAAG